MKLALLFTAIAAVGALALPHHNTIEDCARGLRHASATHTLGIVHECDGLTPAEQDQAVAQAQSVE